MYADGQAPLTASPISARFLRNELRPLSVEIGCGPHSETECLKTDIARHPGVAVVCDAERLPFAPDSVSRIYCRHAFEHLSRVGAERAANEWYAVLRPGGHVEVNVPDIEFHAIQYFLPGESRPLLSRHRLRLSNRDHALLSIYGWQEDQFAFHKWGYSFESLTQLFHSAGFSLIQRIQADMPCNLSIMAYKLPQRPLALDSRPHLARLRDNWNRLVWSLASRATR